MRQGTISETHRFRRGDQVLDFRIYLDYSKKQVEYRIAEVTSELAGMYQEESILLADEREAKARNWINSSEGSISARDRSAEYGSRLITNAVFECRGKIKRLLEEKEFLYYLAREGQLNG